MATPLLLYLLNEASSGTTPTALLDTATGTAVDLTITYGTSSYTSIASGNGVNWNGACGALSAALNGTKVATALAGATQVTWEVRADFNSVASAEGFAYFGTDTGGSDQFYFENQFGALRLTYAGAFVGDFAGIGISGLHTYTYVADTGDATASNRLKFYIDGVLQTLTGASFPAQNTAVDSGATNYANNRITLATAGIVNNAAPTNGKIYYAALYASALSAADVLANHNALASNNDANPNIVLPSVTVQPQTQQVREGQTATFNITASGTGTLHYQWKANGSNVGSDADGYTTAAAAMADNGTVITCVVTDDNGSVTSGQAILVVYEVPPVAWFRA